MLCAGCGEPIGTGSGRGRPARYHNATCRQRAHRARLATDHHDTLAALANLDAAVSDARHAILTGQDPAEGYRRILAATGTLGGHLAPVTPLTPESDTETDSAVTESVTISGADSVPDVPSPPAGSERPVPGPSAPVTVTDAPASETCGGPVTKTVDLAAVIGSGWTLIQHAGDGEASVWHLQRGGRTVGTVCRSYDVSSRARGWEARTADFVRVPALGSLAASRRHDRLWRSRDAAAAGIAAQLDRRRRTRQR
jgi:hypothetical protein